MRKLLRACVAFALLFNLSGCGVIFGGTRQAIAVNSAPPAATIKIDPAGSAMDYTTPSSISLPRKNSYVLTFSSPGYTSAKAEVRNNVRVGILILDFLFTGIIGVGVDALTGGLWSLSPRDVSVTLVKTADNIDGPDTITVTLHPDNEHHAVAVASSVPGVAVNVQPQ